MFHIPVETSGATLRVFLSPPNALGFAVADFAVVALSAFLMVLLVLPRPPSWLYFSLHRLRIRQDVAAVLLAVAPVLLRLLLLLRHPIPIPTGADDFSYLLLGDTLRHGRLSNPSHPWPEFFEQIFVLQSPTRSSIYPLGQGLLLATGWLVFGTPWAGVLITAAALSASVFWMLRGWMGFGWAVVGASISIAQFGPLSYWMNCYWGGFVSAVAGSLVFGAIPRLQAHGRPRHAAVLGFGLALQLVTRPFEFLLLTASVLFFLPRATKHRSVRQSAKVAATACAVLLPAGALVLIHNSKVTGQVFTLPYQLYRHQYGTPATFTFQQNPVPAKILNEEQSLDYQAESAIHGSTSETIRAYFERLVFRLRFLRFFLPAALYLPVVFFLILGPGRDMARVVGALALFAAGSNFYPYFYPHYVAAVSPLLVLLALQAVRKISYVSVNGAPVGRAVAQYSIALSLLPFICWYAVHALASDRLIRQLEQAESWDYLNGQDPAGRATIAKKLAAMTGKQLVFVHYSPGHKFAEWVHNGADMDGSQTIWAHDLGTSEDDRLRAQYPNRQAWILQPDFEPPRLIRIEKTGSGPFEDVP